MIRGSEETQSEKTNRSHGLIMTAIILIAVLAVAFFAYARSGNFNINNFFGDSEPQKAELLYTFGFDPKEKPAFALYKESIVKAGGNKIQLLDKQGNEIRVVDANLAEPILKSSGSYLLAADIGGKDYYLLNNGNLMWSGRSTLNILNADVGKNGYVTVVSASKRYTTEIGIYDDHGIELFRNITANDYAIGAQISPTGKQMAFTGISTSGGKTASFVKFFEISGVEISGATFGEDTDITPFLLYLDDGSLIAAGVSSIICFNKGNEIAWQQSYEKVVSICKAGSRSIAAVINKDGSSYVLMLNYKGEVTAEASFKDEITAISSADGRTAVVCGREVFFINSKGTVLYEYTSKAQISEVLMFNERQAAVFSVNDISVINLD